jgi:cation/acetate symporter
VITTLAASGTDVGNPAFNIAIFLAFVVVTMTLVIRASRTTKKASDFYTGGGQFTGPQNGFAIAGDYLSAASFLGIAGAIAVYGYDGFLYSIGWRQPCPPWPFPSSTFLPRWPAPVDLSPCSSTSTAR